MLHEVAEDPASHANLKELLSRPEIEVDIRQMDGTTPLYRAGLASNHDAFEVLLERGADVNDRNEDNLWTILICAAAANDRAIAEEVLRRPETDVNAADVIENTALHVAAERGHTGIVEGLLARPDIQVDLQNDLGWTALTKAAFAGHDEVVRRLLERSEMDPNLVDQDRQTALFHAASAGNTTTVDLLLSDQRTNTAISNRPGRHTALDMADVLGFRQIADMIRRHQAGIDDLSPNDRYVERIIERPQSSFIRPPSERR